MNRCCVIITAYLTGEIPADEIPGGAMILCADGGYQFAKKAGIQPHAIIGDFDSLDGGRPENPGRGNPKIISLPREKDVTDTLACVQHGIGCGMEHFIIIGGLGGRFDHSFANLQTLSYLTDMGCNGWIVDGPNRGTIIAAKASGKPATITLSGRTGAGFSVFSYGERSEGVSIENAVYPLSDAVLTQSYPLGVSNAFLAGKEARVSVKSGRLLILVCQEG